MVIAPGSRSGPVAESDGGWGTDGQEPAAVSIEFITPPAEDSHALDKKQKEILKRTEMRVSGDVNE